MTFGGRTGGSRNGGTARVQEAAGAASGPRTTTNNGPGRSTCPGSAAGASQEKPYMTVNGIDVVLAVAAVALLFAANHYREWAIWNDNRKRDRRRHVREWHMMQSHDSALHERIRPYRVEQAGDTFPSDWAQAA